MNQKLSLSMFFGGLGSFLMSLGEFLTRHQTWQEMSTPSEVGHIIIITATFCITITGALGINLPRDKNTRVSDRIPKEDIVVSLQEEKKPDAKD